MTDSVQNETIIKPNQDFGYYWKDLFHYSGLFYYLAWRDISVRYKQTVIGVAWSVLRPFLTMIVLTIVFGKVAKLPSGNTPYPILVYAALLPWQFFSNSFSIGSGSLIGNSSLITKVYFPKIILPTTSMIVSFVDFCISFFILLILMVWYQYIPNRNIFFLPIFLPLAMITSLGASFWISALNVRYRDFRYIIPFIVQFGLYISPVGFNSDLIPQKWRLIYSINPMVGVIDGFRWAILGNEINLYLPGFVLSVILAVLLFVSGFIYFRAMEKTFADVI